MFLGADSNRESSKILQCNIRFGRSWLLLLDGFDQWMIKDAKASTYMRAYATHKHTVILLQHEHMYD